MTSSYAAALIIASMAALGAAYLGDKVGENSPEIKVPSLSSILPEAPLPSTSTLVRVPEEAPLPVGEAFPLKQGSNPYDPVEASLPSTSTPVPVVSQNTIRPSAQTTELERMERGERTPIQKQPLQGQAPQIFGQRTRAMQRMKKGLKSASDEEEQARREGRENINDGESVSSISDSELGSSGNVSIDSKIYENTLETAAEELRAADNDKDKAEIWLAVFNELFEDLPLEERQAKLSRLVDADFSRESVKKELNIDKKQADQLEKLKADNNIHIPKNLKLVPNPLHAPRKKKYADALPNILENAGEDVPTADSSPAGVGLLQDAVAKLDSSIRNIDPRAPTEEESKQIDEARSEFIRTGLNTGRVSLSDIIINLDDATRHYQINLPLEEKDSTELINKTEKDFDKAETVQEKIEVVVNVLSEINKTNTKLSVQNKQRLDNLVAHTEYLKNRELKKRIEAVPEPVAAQAPVAPLQSSSVLAKNVEDAEHREPENPPAAPPAQRSRSAAIRRDAAKQQIDIDMGVLRKMGKERKQLISGMEQQLASVGQSGKGRDEDPFIEDAIQHVQLLKERGIPEKEIKDSCDEMLKDYESEIRKACYAGEMPLSVARTYISDTRKILHGSAKYSDE